MSAKRFNTLTGFLTNVSPVKEGKKQHNWAEGHIQTGASTEQKVLFFFEKPKTSNAAYESAVAAYKEKTAVAVSGLSEDGDGKLFFYTTHFVRRFKWKNRWMVCFIIVAFNHFRRKIG